MVESFLEDKVKLENTQNIFNKSHGSFREQSICWKIRNYQVNLNEPKELFLMIKRDTDTLIVQTRTRRQANLECKLNRTKQTLPIDVPSKVEKDRLTMRLTHLETVNLF